MTEEIIDDAVELEAEGAATASAEAVEAAETSDADASGVSDRGDESDKPGSVPKSKRAYLLGFNEQKMRQLIADVDYKNRGRVGSPFPDDFVERVLDHPAIQGEKSLSAARTAILKLRVDELGSKSNHPKGR